jgi:hypothetical protein
MLSRCQFFLSQPINASAVSIKNHQVIVNIPNTDAQVHGKSQKITLKESKIKGLTLPKFKIFHIATVS